MNTSPTATDETCTLISSCWVQQTSVWSLGCFWYYNRGTSRCVCIWSLSTGGGPVHRTGPGRERSRARSRGAARTRPAISRLPHTPRINGKSLHQKGLTARVLVFLSLAPPSSSSQTWVLLVFQVSPFTPSIKALAEPVKPS